MPPSAREVAAPGKPVFTGELACVRTFGDVKPGAPLLYLNSLLSVSIALNMDNFAINQGISAGAEWSVRLEKVSR